MLGLLKDSRKKAEVPSSIAASSQQDDILHPSCFRRLAESCSGHALFLLDTESCIRSWNAGAFELFGYTRSEVLGKPLQFLMQSGAQKSFEYDETLWQARQAGDEGWEASRSVQHHDGRTLTALVRVTAFYDANRNIMGYGVAAKQDECGAIEGDYQDSLALLETIVEALHDPLFLKDREGRYLLFNSAFADHIGIPVEVIRGKTDPELLSPEDCLIASRTDQIVLETEAPHEYEYSQGQDAEVQVTQVTKLPFYNAMGQVCGVFGFARDATLKRHQELQKESLLAGEHEARKAAERTVRQLQAIHTVFETALTTLESPSLIAELLDRIMKVLGADTASVCLLTEDKKHLIHCQSRGTTSVDEEEGVITVGEGLLGRIVSENQPVILADRREHGVGTLFEDQMIRGFIGSPLYLDGQVLGVLSLGSHHVGHFSEDDLQILRLVADRAASAIERARLFEELNAANAAMHQLSHRMLEIQEEERRHIARELHDEIGQMLTGIKLHIQNLPLNANGEASAEELAAHAHTAGIYVDNAIAEVRRLSTGLRPPALDVLGLESALRECAERMATQAGIQHKVNAENIGRFDHDMEITLFRIAQEALTNVVRHARAKSVCISVQRTHSDVTLSVIDDGVGFDYQTARSLAEHGRSYGLRGMEERAVLMDGTLLVKSRLGKGTSVKASFIFRDDEQEELAFDAVDGHD